MKKYILDVSIGQRNTAGQKAKKDITNILKKDGFNNVTIKLSKSKIFKLLFSGFEVKRALSKFNKNDVFVIQYPMYSRITTRRILNECRKKGIKTICLIHDLESLRLYKNNKKKISEELNILKEFDCLIAHNDAMISWLKVNGMNKRMLSLDIFDYINIYDVNNIQIDKNLIFAGNLAKSEFLKKWNLDRQLDLFGVNPSDNYSEKINYKGVKSPDELPKYLDGSFGLVWDGTSMDTNDGVYGEYTKYNNPHKVSLYLSSGLPVIVWKKAAIANFVSRNGIGLTIGSLNELDNILNKMGNKQYVEMVGRVNDIRKKLNTGFFTRTVITKALEIVSE